MQSLRPLMQLPCNGLQSVGHKIHLPIRYPQPEDSHGKVSVPKKLRTFAHDLQLLSVTHSLFRVPLPECLPGIEQALRQEGRDSDYLQLLKQSLISCFSCACLQTNLYRRSNRCLQELEKENSTS